MRKTQSVVIERGGIAIWTETHHTAVPLKASEPRAIRGDGEEMETLNFMVVCVVGGEGEEGDVGAGEVYEARAGEDLRARLGGRIIISPRGLIRSRQPGTR